MNHTLQFANTGPTVDITAVVFMKTTIVLTSVGSSQTAAEPEGKPLFCESNETEDSAPPSKPNVCPKLAQLAGPGEAPYLKSRGQVSELTFSDSKTASAIICHVNFVN